jgi:formylglycine-generating enzyme required for sulfatase activity
MEDLNKWTLPVELLSPTLRHYVRWMGSILFAFNFNFCFAEPIEVFLEAQTLHFQSKTWKVKPFLMDRFEVSQKEYENLIKKGGLSPSSFANLSGFSDPDQPVVGVDFFDARLFCNYQGKRLPTYLEFLRASQGEVPREYPFGNEFPAFKKAPFVTHSQKPQFPVTVQSFPEFRTPEGIYHLAGNVSEWSSDRSTSRARVYGGSYISGVRGVRVGSFEKVELTENLRKDIGFRCARNAVKDLELAGIQHLDPTALKSMFYKLKADRGELLEQDTRQRIKRIQSRTRYQEEMDRKNEIRSLSLQELKRRELLVSQELSLKETEMTGIPPGYFWMGKNELKNSDPKHLVYLDPYEIGKNLVTVGQVLPWMKESQSSSSATKQLLLHDAIWKPALLTWGDAQAYCSHHGLDLPTEAQWEKAVVGLDRTELKSRIPRQIQGGYFQVEIPKSISEWTRDYFSPYPVEPLADRRNPQIKRGLLRTIRGRGVHPESLSDPSQRKAALSFARHGFRCVRTSKAKPGFIIDREWNYFFPEFFIEMKKRIQAYENVFNLQVKADS